MVFLVLQLNSKGLFWSDYWLIGWSLIAATSKIGWIDKPVFGLWKVCLKLFLSLHRLFCRPSPVCQWSARVKRSFKQFKCPCSLHLVSNVTVQGLYWSVWGISSVCMNLVTTGSMQLSTDVSQTIYRHQTHLCCMKWMSASVHHLCKVCIGMC